MGKIAIVFASKGGQTKKIARYMEEKLQEHGCSTQLIDTNGPTSTLASSVDTVIFGSPVYGGKFRRPLLRWISAHRLALSRATSALFTVSLNAADRHDRARRDDDRLLREFMTQTGWTPDYTASLAGALNYRNYSWLLRWLMKRISHRAGGDTDTSKNFEYTDWAQVDDFLDAVVFAKRESRFATGVRFPELAHFAALPVAVLSGHDFENKERLCR